MSDREYTYPGSIVGIIVMILYFLWIKPDCRTDYVTVFALGSGWVCQPGYKP